MPEADKNPPQNPGSPQRSRLPPALQGVRPPGPGQPVPPMRPSAAPPPTLPRPAIPAAAPKSAPPAGNPSRTQTPSSRQNLADALSKTAWDAARAEDASVIAPQPPVSALGLQHRPTSRQQDPLRLRRTVIPILLTAGVLLGASGIYLRLAGTNDTLSDLLPSWAAIVFIILGGLSLAMGILNMLSVRNALAGGRAPR
jgi:hypothetical protein